MSENDFVVDIHCHPNLKSYYSSHPKPTVNMWEKIYHKTDQNAFARQIDKRSKHVLKESQSNFYELAAGDVRVINISLYPIEKGFLHIRDIPKWLIGANNVDIIQEVITGFDAKKMKYLKKTYNYYEDLLDEYEYVKSNQGKSPDGKYSFVIANNYNELQAALKKKNTIVGIMSIEGAHVFGTGSPDVDRLNEEDHKLLLDKHLKKVKSWEHPPFTINLAHHFWNQLCGHATTFKSPIGTLINQNKGKDKGILPMGWHVIRELLSKENGKRIIIDTKHMSALARREYYAFIENYNYLNPKDPIPVISSHTGVNGFATLESSIKQKDTPAKTKNHRFYKWSLNISNDEIKVIHKSGGLLGLMLDKGNLGGLDTVKKISSITELKKQKDEFCKLFWDNAFHCVKVIEDKSGWDCISLGSDFDGSITHMDPYETASKLPQFKQDLITYLEETEHQKELWFKYTPEKLVHKIMQENAMKFYERFFV
jgi:microsomal dipeptidase-like Zn-dependent dipeptidase